MLCDNLSFFRLSGPVYIFKNAGFPFFISSFVFGFVNGFFSDNQTPRGALLQR
jgi:hypothetical protein